jgi:hypothetical protein
MSALRNLVSDYKPTQLMAMINYYLDGVHSNLVNCQYSLLLEPLNTAVDIHTRNKIDDVTDKLTTLIDISGYTNMIPERRTKISDCIFEIQQWCELVRNVKKATIERFFDNMRVISSSVKISNLTFGKLIAAARRYPSLDRYTDDIVYLNTEFSKKLIGINSLALMEMPPQHDVSASFKMDVDRAIQLLREFEPDRYLHSTLDGMFDSLNNTEITPAKFRPYELNAAIADALTGGGHAVVNPTIRANKVGGYMDIATATSSISSDDRGVYVNIRDQVLVGDDSENIGAISPLVAGLLVIDVVAILSPLVQGVPGPGVFPVYTPAVGAHGGYTLTITALVNGAAITQDVVVPGFLVGATSRKVKEGRYYVPVPDNNDVPIAVSIEPIGAAPAACISYSITFTYANYISSVTQAYNSDIIAINTDTKLSDILSDNATYESLWQQYLYCPTDVGKGNVDLKTFIQMKHGDGLLALRNAVNYLFTPTDTRAYLLDKYRNITARNLGAAMLDDEIINFLGNPYLWFFATVNVNRNKSTYRRVLSELREDLSILLNNLQGGDGLTNVIVNDWLN